MDIPKIATRNDRFLFETTHTACHPAIGGLVPFEHFSRRWHQIQTPMLQNRLAMGVPSHNQCGIILAKYCEHSRQLVDVVHADWIGTERNSPKFLLCENPVSHKTEFFMGFRFNK